MNSIEKLKKVEEDMKRLKEQREDLEQCMIAIAERIADEVLELGMFTVENWNDNGDLDIMPEEFVERIHRNFDKLEKILKEG